MKARLPKGVGGGPQDMNAMIKQAQKMQTEMAAVTEELEAKNYEATVGGGAVKAVISGKKEVVALTISPEVVDKDDVPMLQDLIISAINEAIRNAEKESEEAMSSITGGMQMPF